MKTPQVIPLITALLACFAIAQSARAVTPEPDGGDANGIATEEQTAVPGLSTGTENGAIGQQQAKENHPNHRVININVTELIPRPCGLEVVELRGQLHLSFGVVEQQGVRVVEPKNIQVEAFSGTGKSIGRKYEAGRVKVSSVKTRKLNGLGVGKFPLEVHVTGRPKPQGDPNPTKVVPFRLVYREVLYEWGPDNKVTRLVPGSPEVLCGH